MANYNKLGEIVTMRDVISVIISPTTNGIEALYVNGNLAIVDDTRPYRSSRLIAGFLAGLRHAGWEFEVQNYAVDAVSPVAQALVSFSEPVPKKLRPLIRVMQHVNEQDVGAPA
jgi:hypothetical protein